MNTVLTLRSSLILIGIICHFQILGQPLTFSEHIEPIVLKNCSPCHRENGAAPFSLLTYQDVTKWANMIQSVTESRYMPPWKADSEFQQYAFERRLDKTEIELIKKWIEGGMVKGKKSKKKVVAETLPTRTPDLILKMSSPYQLSDQNKDDYRFYSIPTNLPADTYISSIEFIPGNRRSAHHSRIMTDTSHHTRSIDGLSAEDPKIRDFDKHPPLDRFFYGWVPGNFRFDFPAGTAKKILKQTDFILNIHYAPNSKPEQFDQSSINLYFAKGKVDREVHTLTVDETSISNPPFIIKANTKPTFYASFGPIPVDITALAVLPHMHYLGKTFKAFAITPEGDAVHLIKIDDWDFRWQSTYQFNKFLFIPKNSVILIEATYDNTEENPENQFSPPRDITYGWNSTSEMMNLVMYYLEYKKGDELKITH